ncbi:hypothetical protein [Nocardia sp. NPDC004860]|uniref:hypothetical protein n=1 Tax=Nocardia sp. NPDC004860 TaxID=3154557 RepID=UPI0033B4AC7B
MSDLRGARWTWRFLVALAITGGLCLASSVSYIVNFDHVEHWSQLFAVLTVASAALFWFVGWVPLRSRDQP